MSKSLNWSAVSQWQQLMVEWDAASAEYESTKARAEDPGIDDAQRTRLRATVDDTLARLRELKVSIDELVAKGTAERPAPDGLFTAATVELDLNDVESRAGAKRLRS